MKVAVAGLWHLGSVTAACCAYGGHEVVGFDDQSDVIARLNESRPLVDEPGLAALIKSQMASGNLRFTSDPCALSLTDILWVCYDTPVNENDEADMRYVLSRVESLLPHLPTSAEVLISSQLPVGSTSWLERSNPGVRFSYSPENLRLGKAIEVFTKPDRVVVGVRNEQSREKIVALLAPFTNKIEWMSVESGEMTKHAINAFLATSVAFINELASVCEQTKADAQEVERGLKSDARIGEQAYLHPGSAFAGGTLARDLSFLRCLSNTHQLPAYLFRGVIDSNTAHRQWVQRRLKELLGDLRQRTIGVLGLTYKPGTDTLRRSNSIEICRSLNEQGVTVRAFDPAIKELSEDLAPGVELKESPEEVFAGADAVLILTPWPEFKSIPAELFSQRMRRRLVLDPARHLEALLGKEAAIEYVALGRGI